MSDLFGNHIVGFPTRRLIYFVAVLKTAYHVICEPLIHFQPLLKMQRQQAVELKSANLKNNVELFVDFVKNSSTVKPR